MLACAVSGAFSVSNINRDIIFAYTLRNSAMRGAKK